MNKISGSDGTLTTTPIGCFDRWLRENESLKEVPSESRRVEAALELAKLLQERAMELQTPAERRQQAELDRMIQHPQDKATLMQMTDQGFRSNSADRIVDQMVHILDVQGVPRFFSPFDRTLLKGFQSFGEYLPGVAVPLVKEKMRKETANVILPAERDMLCHHLMERRSDGLRMNVNFLGEAILGEQEARRRLENYLEALQWPAIECVSVKISTLYSQISTIARRNTVDVLCDRLELLYRAAAKESYQKADGESVPKFVYLDMEEYRDMRLTAEAFMKTLDRHGLERVMAGIALQAYIPDSFLVQQELTEWAIRRMQRGGTPATIRIVKGANMEMERVEASLRGWPQAPYKQKIESDANFKRMLHYGMKTENLAAVRLGIASHNLFDMAYAFTLAYLSQAFDQVQFEMLEGMANHQRRALQELCRNVLLYAPACRREEFINAIGYLIRRLDENTGPDNFLRHAFKIKAESGTWKRLENGFLQSLNMSEEVALTPRRTQNRNQPPLQPPAPTRWQDYVNEPDSDFSLPHNGAWAEQIIASWEPRHDAHCTVIPLSLGSGEEAGNGAEFRSMDPSRPGVVVALYNQASPEQISRAVDDANRDDAGWRHWPAEDRYRILRQVAQEIRVARGDLIGAALADGGKTIAESDPEVSEAVDFVEFYARCALECQQQDLGCQPMGIVVVVSPWNFPIAIPCGGIAAALAMGNSVILKPASDTVLPAWVLCECFWRAGVPRSALQFLPCSGTAAGDYLLPRPEVGTVILTGGTETAKRMLRKTPKLRLLAETGGKNATIVSSLSDRDLAIKNVLHSAFSHSGQKCSATSLLLLEEEVFHDSSFRDQLADAAASLQVGSAWDLSTKMGPLIRPPEGDLLRGLKVLEHGEFWVNLPTTRESNPCLFTPGIKWNVSRGSFTHTTELFGPVLGVMKYKKLGEAIESVNETGYGLTSGLETLDDREQKIWKERIRAGNLYINRPTTGAIVLRQPFGGMGKSAFGPGIKAGGPNYVIPLGNFSANARPLKPGSLPEIELLKSLLSSLGRPTARSRFLALPDNKETQLQFLISSIISFDQFARDEIRTVQDHVRLLGQDNLRRFLPMKQLRYRISANDAPWMVFAVCAAAVACGSRIIVSHAEGVHFDTLQLLEDVTHDWAGRMEMIEEDEDQLVQAILNGQVDRLRILDADSVSDRVRQAAFEAHIHLADRPLSLHGRIELLWYVEEQSLSFDYHRYGNLGLRGSESRAEPL